MGWTNPSALGATFSVGELVTSAKMNAQLSDNLRYLKGMDGAVLIGDTLQASSLGIGIAPSASYAAYIKSTNLPIRIEQGSSATDYLRLYNNQAASNEWGFRIRDLAEGDFGIRDVTANAYRMYMTSGGFTGFGTTSPQGKIHAVGAISGVLHWEYNGVDGTARAVLPTASVAYAVTGIYTVRSSGGSRQGGILGNIALGVSTNIADFNASADVCQLQVLAGGGVQVIRTAGSQTYKVALWLLSL